MNLDKFLQQRQDSWRRLEQLLDKVRDARSSDRAIAQAEIDDLGRLYRAATADLALAQRDFPAQQATAYLNGLVGRAHATLYRGQPLRRDALPRFYRTTFPRLYRDLLPYTSAAFLLFFLPSLAAFVLVRQAPEQIFTLLGESEELRELVRLVERGELWTEIAPTVRSAASTAILTRNIQVMFLAFGGGVLAGLLTVYVMIVNGLNIGAIFGLLQYHGLSAGLAEFVLAHGFIELSVIFVAGGCGLYLGDGLLRPGLYSRGQALVRRAVVGAQVILGCVPLLVLAGFIEGLISPSGLPWSVKLLVGAGSGIALHGYWLRAGR